MKRGPGCQKLTPAQPTIEVPLFIFLDWLFTSMGSTALQPRFKAGESSQKYLNVGVAFDPTVQPVCIEMEAQGSIPKYLVKVAHGEIVVADMAESRAGRRVYAQSYVLAKLTDAEQMGGIAHDHDRFQIVFVRDGSQTMDLLLGIDGAGFGDDVAERNAAGQQIISSDAALGVSGVLVAASAKGDDERRNLLAIELDGMVEASMKYRRGMSHVFRRAEYGDGVGRLGLVLIGNFGNLLIDPDKPAQSNKKEDPQKAAKKDATPGQAVNMALIGGRDRHGQ